VLIIAGWYYTAELSNIRGGHQRFDQIGLVSRIILLRKPKCLPDNGPLHITADGADFQIAKNFPKTSLGLT